MCSFIVHRWSKTFFPTAIFVSTSGHAHAYLVSEFHPGYFFVRHCWHNRRKILVWYTSWVLFTPNFWLLTLTGVRFSSFWSSLRRFHHKSSEITSLSDVPRCLGLLFCLKLIFSSQPDYQSVANLTWSMSCPMRIFDAIPHVWLHLIVAFTIEVCFERRRWSGGIRRHLGRAVHCGYWLFCSTLC